MHQPQFVFLNLDALSKPTSVAPLNRDGFSGEAIEKNSVEPLTLTSVSHDPAIAIGGVENDVVDTDLQVATE